MSAHEGKLQNSVCISALVTTESSKIEANCSGSDGMWDDLEVDIRTGYHRTTPSNSSYDNINYSLYLFPNDIWIQKPDWELGLQAVAFIVVVILGIVGNVLLLSIVLHNRSIRTPTNLLIANMAVSDLATLIILPWIFICMDCFQNYILGEIGCKSQGVFESSLLLIGVLNLVAVSYDRLSAIVSPLEGRLTIQRTRIIMVCAWITGIFLGTPLIFFRNYKERQWKNFHETYCAEEPAVTSIYWYVVIVFVVWLPLLVMVLCYSCLFYKLCRYEKKVMCRKRPICVGYKTRVARTLFVVVVVFVICRIPFTALIFLRSKLQDNTQTINQISDGYSTLWFISHYLIIVNAALDPIIYGLTNENFRRAFRSTGLAKCLCGASASVSIPQSPRLPLNKLEPKDLYNQKWRSETVVLTSKTP